MRQSHLLLFNTVAVYLRMALTFPMGLLAVRFIYGGLGEVDFGLWTAIGASTALVAVVTTALINSGQRHLSYAIGVGDEIAVRQLFGTVLTVFWSMGLVILIGGMLVAPLVLSALVIPVERFSAAQWVLNTSIFIVAVQIATTPYRAILSAYQLITPVASLEFLRSVLSFANAWSISYVTADRLMVFAIAEAIIVVMCGFCTIGLALHRVASSRIIPTRVVWLELREVGLFAFWSFLGNMGGTLRGQGGILLANVLFGPVANAAIALAVKVHAFIYQAASATLVAISPAMNTHAGKQNDAAVQRLMNLGCKLPFAAASIIFTPLVFETSYLLDIWQAKPVPPETAIHTRWLCGMALVGVATWGHSLVLEAFNKIARPMAWLLVTIALSLIVAWAACYFLRWPAWTISMIMCLGTVFASFGVRAWITSQVVGVTYGRLLYTTVLPNVVAMMPAFLIALCVHVMMPQGITRLLAIVSVYLLATAVTTWYIAFDSYERDTITEIVRRIHARIVRAS